MKLLSILLMLVVSKVGIAQSNSAIQMPNYTTLPYGGKTFDTGKGIIYLIGFDSSTFVVHKLTPYPKQKIFYGTAGIINTHHKRKLHHMKHHNHPLIKK